MLQIDEYQYKSIGKYSRNLISFSENSVYKLLYTHDNINSNSLNTNSKNIRNNYLKKLVEANEEYFPAELKQEKLRKNLPVSYEEKFNLKNKLEIEKFNSAKEKNKNKENKINNNLNKKRNREEDLSRKDSLVFENNKNEKDEFLNKENNNNNKNKNKKNNDEEKNINNKNEFANNNINNNNNNKKNNKVIEDDDQTEKEESNQDDQSFDEYRMESEENMSKDFGSENDERDYSDGGVF